MILFLPLFFSFWFLLKYSWFTMCVSEQSDSVVYIYYTHIYSFTDSFPL